MEQISISLAISKKKKKNSGVTKQTHSISLENTQNTLATI